MATVLKSWCGQGSVSDFKYFFRNICALGACSQVLGIQILNMFRAPIRGDGGGQFLLSWWLLFSHSAVSDSWRPHGLQHAIALTIGTFVSKGMSLLFNMLSKFFIDFFSKEQVSFDFKAPVTIYSDCGAQESKICYYFHCFPICLPWSNSSRCHDLSLLNVEF